ncbi:MAG: hypothetical protein ACLFPD_00075 [Desulfosudaceae bacterium]
MVLAALPPERFEHREWVALTWVRTYLDCEGTFPDPDLPEQFNALFSADVQVCVLAVCKLMLFFNMLANTVLPDKPLPEGAACVISPTPPTAADNPRQRE